MSESTNRKHHHCRERNGECVRVNEGGISSNSLVLAIEGPPLGLVCSFLSLWLMAPESAKEQRRGRIECICVRCMD